MFFKKKFLSLSTTSADVNRESRPMEIECLEDRVLLSGNLVAVDDIITPISGQQVVVDVLANDLPAEQVSILEFTQPENGSVTDVGGGNLAFTSELGFIGTDSFEYQIGSLTQQLQAGDTVSRDRFGSSVDLDGEFAIVGARLAEGVGQPTSSGLAYIFRNINGSWVEVATLQAPDAAAGDYFGWSVEIDGDVAVVGAQRTANGSITEAGSAYVFSRNQGGVNNWGLVTKLENPAPAKLDQFGSDVAIDGNTIAVASWLDDDPEGAGTNHGSVSIFERNLGGTNNWGLSKTLFGNGDPNQPRDQFGSSIAIENDTLVVGSVNYGTANTGAVFVFDRNQDGLNAWGEVQQIDNPEPNPGDGFGFSVSLNAGSLAVGNPRDDFGASVNAGSVFVFEQNAGGSNQWGQVAKLSPNAVNDSRDGTANDQFGSSISIAGDRLVVGAPATNGTFGASGLVYQYRRDASQGWQFSELIRPADEGPGDRFGSEVAVSGSDVLIGVPLDNQLGIPLGLSPGTNDGTVHFVNFGTDTATVNVNVSTLPPLIVDTISEVSDGNFSTGNLSLREAIELANFVPGADIITFNETSGVFADSIADTITLSSQLEITDSLTISSPTTAELTIDVRGFTKIFDIRGQQSNQIDVSLERLTLTNAGSDAAGTGAIDVQYSGLNISDSVISSGASGIKFLGDTKALNISDSSFLNNKRGVLVVSDSSAVNIVRSEFRGNTNDSWRSESGGGIIVSRSSGATGKTTIVDSLIVDNFSAYGSGGGVDLTGDAIIRRSIISGNRTNFSGGGGVHLRRGNLEIVESTIENNSTSSKGGGILQAVGSLSIVNSTISGNQSKARGGGIYQSNGSLSIVNSTISGNQTRSNIESGGGGGIFHKLGDISIVNSTVVGNHAGFNSRPELAVGGIFSASGQILIHNSIVAGNTVHNSIVPGERHRSIAVALPNPDRPILSDIGGGGTVNLSSSHNLIGDPDAAGGLVNGVNGNILGDGAGNLLPLTVIVNPLDDNGGPTHTHSLVVSSPAIDAGTTSVTAGVLSTDQRGAGFGRVRGLNVDIGSFEL